MAFKRRKYRLTNCIEVVECHTARYGAPGQPRTPSRKPTPEAVRRNNQRRKERRCSRMVDKYFNEDDYILTLTYRKECRPSGMQECVEHLQKFFRKLKSEYAKRFYELFWIRNIEVGPRGSWHVHVVMNRIEGADYLIKSYWKEHGGVYFQFYSDHKDRGEDIGKYIAKSNISAPDKITESSWSHSRNVKEVEPEETVIFGHSMNDAPRTPKGYYLDKDSYKDYINDEGYRHREYIFRKIDPVRIDHTLKKRKKKKPGSVLSFRKKRPRPQR